MLCVVHGFEPGPQLDPRLHPTAGDLGGGDPLPLGREAQNFRSAARGRVGDQGRAGGASAGRLLVAAAAAAGPAPGRPLSRPGHSVDHSLRTGHWQPAPHRPGPPVSLEPFAPRSKGKLLSLKSFKNSSTRPIIGRSLRIVFVYTVFAVFARQIN